MNLTIQYYVWWIHHTCLPYLTWREKQSLFANMEKYGNNEQWVLSAVRKLLDIKKQNLRIAYAQNSKSRVLGRQGEQLVFDRLTQNGWSIETFTDQAIRPKYGVSTVGYDIVARYEDNKPRYIEVKTSDSPMFILGYKCYATLQRNLNRFGAQHYMVFIKNETVYYARSAELRFIHQIPNANYTKLTYAWVIDPECLKVLN